MRGFLSFVSVIAALSLPAAGGAATISDPAGDFVPGFIGSTTLDGDLDVTSFSVTYDAGASAFVLGATLAAPIDTTRPGLYVIGVNTGTGPSAPFGPIGAGDVRFNQAFQVLKNGTVTLGGNTIVPLNILVSGNQFSVTLAASLFPSTGFSAENYGWNLWPRLPGGGLTSIADLAPDNGVLASTGIVSVPEPASWAMMIAGFGMLGAAARRRKRIATA